MEKESQPLERLIIANQEAFEQKLNKLKEGGAEKLHVLTDFDRTLTKGMVDGERTPSIISRIRAANYLSEEYVKEAHRLFDHYRPIETDESIPLEKRVEEMHAWWQKHFKLLAESGLDLHVLQQVVDEHPRMFREGVMDFLDAMHKKDVPVVIMSASIGDMIRLYLEKHGKMYPSIHIISNLFEFDEEGKVIGVKEPIVHSLNKDEVLIKESPVFAEVQDRKNVLLMGDGTGDLGMIEGFDYDEMLAIGFYNLDYEKEGALDAYKQAYDLLITGDASMEEVNKLVKEVLG